MTGSDLLDTAAAERERYLAAYRRALAEYRASHENVVAEVMLELGGDASSLFERLYRVDALWKEADGPAIREINVDLPPFAPPRQVVHGPATFELHPFVWNGVEIAFATAVALEPDLSVWFGKWMDLDDKSVTDEAGLGGVIHSLGVPDWSKNGWGFSIDFGSAPIAAVAELLDLCAYHSPAGCKLGSFSYE